MNNTLTLILIVLMSPNINANEIIELSTFPNSSDYAIETCYKQAILATSKGKDLCNALNNNDNNEYWVCIQSKEIRLKSLNECNAKAENAKNQAAMLYLLGLLHQDFNYQAFNQDCPDFFRYQEGSSVCVYTEEHFNKLLEKYPKSKYADMAAYKWANKYYRYYECEGQALCSIENQIAGWIKFLEKRPKSIYSSLAIDKIIKAFVRLPNLILKPNYETTNGLIRDIKNLKNITAKLSKNNRKKLNNSLNKAEILLQEIEEKIEIEIKH